MLNREIFSTVPSTTALKNNGVVKVDTQQQDILQYELKTFVCKGQYNQGLIDIVSNYLNSLGELEQKGVWVSGFYGSGKSHFVKMLAAFWKNEKFSDGSDPIGLAKLSDEFKASLTELHMAGKREGGLHAAIGTLSGKGNNSVKLAALSILFKSLGLPEAYNRAQFVMFLKEKGYLEPVKSYCEEHGADFDEEIDNLLVAETLFEALHEVAPNHFVSVEVTAQIIMSQYGNKDDITNDEFVSAFKKALKLFYNGKIPLTLLVIDELQQFIGNDGNKALLVQDLVQTCCSEMESKVLFVATGQSAITATPSLKKIEGRFPLRVELVDTDANEVVRNVVLLKKPEVINDIKKVMDDNLGELSRELKDTEFRFREEDKESFVQDYPILPMRRKFWEVALQVMDTTHTGSQIRNQLSLINKTVSGDKYLNGELGTIIGTDEIYFEQANEMHRYHFISDDAYSNIEKWINSSSEDDKLKARAYALIFLIGKISRDRPNLNLKADVTTLADLLITDLREGTTALREKLETILNNCKELNKVDDEYRIQTKVSAEWNDDFEKERAALSNDETVLDVERTKRIQDKFSNLTKKIKLLQGETKTVRDYKTSYSATRPSDYNENVYLWVMDGWATNESNVKAESAQLANAGTVCCVYIPRTEEDRLRDEIKNSKAASRVIEARRAQATSSIEAKEAFDAMSTILINADNAVSQILEDAISKTKIYVSGQEIAKTSTIDEAIKKELNNCIANLYKDFKIADQLGWDKVYEKAAKGDSNALSNIGYTGEIDQHPVCKTMLSFITAGRKGTEIVKEFSEPHYGWSKDTIDGAIQILLVGNKIKAENERREAVDPTKLQRKEIGKTLFKLESPSLTTKEIIEIRGIINKLTPCSSTPDIATMHKFISGLETLQNEVTGNEPLPVKETFKVINDLNSCTGNEQLKVILDNKDVLTSKIKTWQENKNLLDTRWESWNQLEKLINFTKDLEQFDSNRQTYSAIKQQRLLLDPSDPATNALKTIEEDVRNLLNEIKDRLQKKWDKGEKYLEADENFNKLTPEQKYSLRTKVQFCKPPVIEVSSTKEIIDTLTRNPITALNDKIAAIVSNVLTIKEDAAKLLEPTTQTIHLSTPTLKTEVDVDNWLKETKEKLMAALSNGPVIPRC